MVGTGLFGFVLRSPDYWPGTGAYTLVYGTPAAVALAALIAAAVALVRGEGGPAWLAFGVGLTTLLGGPLLGLIVVFSVSGEPLP